MKNFSECTARKLPQKQTKKTKQKQKSQSVCQRCSRQEGKNFESTTPDVKQQHCWLKRKSERGPTICLL